LYNRGVNVMWSFIYVAVAMVSILAFAGFGPLFIVTLTFLVLGFMACQKWAERKERESACQLLVMYFGEQGRGHLPSFLRLQELVHDLLEQAMRSEEGLLVHGRVFPFCDIRQGKYMDSLMRDLSQNYAPKIVRDYTFASGGRMYTVAAFHLLLSAWHRCYGQPIKVPLYSERCAYAHAAS